jgi:hypothetical protein
MRIIATADQTSWQHKTALIIGYLAITTAVLGAYLSPATGYEVNIYTATPAVFWLGLGVAMVMALFASFYAPRGYLSIAGLILGGSSMIATASLPLMRGYYYLGTGDSLTHLGWVQDILAGRLSPFELFYPGLHTVSIFFHQIIGLNITRSIMLFVTCIILTYFIFVPLCIRAITGQDGALLIGVFAAFLLLALNQIATHISAHPITDAVFFSPLILYLLVQYLLTTPETSDPPSKLLVSISSTRVLLAASLVAIILYHPQQAANLLLLFATISTVQFGARRYSLSDPMRAHQTLYKQTTLLAALFVAWVAWRGKFRRTLGTVLTEVVGLVLESSNDTAAIVQQRGGSLAAIGASTANIFLKLFFISSLFAALVALLMLVSLLGDDGRSDPNTVSLLQYFSIGLAVLVPYSFAFFIGVASSLFFRNLGFIMVITTLLGAIAIHRYMTVLSVMFTPEWIRLATVIIFGFMLVLSTAVLYPSPYIFQASGHVSDNRISGYETAFTHQNESVLMYGARDGPWRFRDAIVGVAGVESSRYNQQGYYGKNLTDIRAQSNEDRYFVYSKANVRREIKIFRGLRFSRKQFNSLSRQPGIHRIQASSEVYLYYINSITNNATVQNNAKNGSGGR